MPFCRLDHLAIAAATLEQGVAYLEEQLGVTVPQGGKHPLMGTHNRLMQLGPDAFLEIIAIDPDADQPARPRWFHLDDPIVQALIAQQPRLLTWVVRTDDIEAATKASPIAVGEIKEGRRGDLVWQITVPKDGSMPEDGLFPTLIQWPDSLMPNGPASNMADLGCTLESLHIAHTDPERFGTALGAIGAGGLAEIDTASEEIPPGLTAWITSPKGRVALR